MKAATQLTRQNSNPRKAEVKKAAEQQAQDKTEHRPEKTTDSTTKLKDATTDGKLVNDKSKEERGLGCKMEPGRDGSVGDDVLMNADQMRDEIVDGRDAVTCVNDVKSDVQVKDPVVNNGAIKDRVNARDVKDVVTVKGVRNEEKTSTVNSDSGGDVKGETNGGKSTESKYNGLLGISNSEDVKEGRSKSLSDVNRNTSKQNNTQVNNVDQQNFHRKDGMHKIDAVNNSDLKTRTANTPAETDKQKKTTTDDNDSKKDDELENNRHRLANGHGYNRTRTGNRRDTKRRQNEPKDESDESDDDEDHLPMDNELVRHLLPHMSPALLPKAMQKNNRARDSPSSSNSAKDAHPALTPKTSLNVIRERSENDDVDLNEEDEDESEEEEAMAPPPPTMTSLRRHSFHQFPAPPKISQSKNAEKVRALLQAVELEELGKISKKLGEKTDLVRQHIGHVENRLFEMFGDKDKKTININKFLMGLTAAGMRPSDPRLKHTRENLKNLQDQLGNEFVSLDIDYETFMGIISENLEIIVKAFSASFVIPDFQGFCKQIEDIYNLCHSNHSGKPAQYIPQLARYDSKPWGMAVCTVDGQRFSLGDVEVPFTIQSCSKPLTYAIGLAVNGTDYMHKYVGMEPSGRYFNELVLDYCNMPHNPMINSGAIMTAAIIKPELSAADRFDYMFNVYKRLVGNEHLGFNNSVFLSERECADRNFALAYFMRENKCFPANHKLHESLDFYFQLCSLEITAESGAVIAATLANGGLNPLTDDPVLTVEAVRNTLTLMHSCGMYNYSGQFAFHVGLPAKSGVSGCVLLVIPNTMGICLWSPPLDSNGNSCRGVQFCMEMVNRFNFHNFDNLRGYSVSKQDPRTTKTESKAQVLFDLLFSAAAGDMSAIRRHSLAGIDMHAKDYDGRTALHVATSEGHDEVVDFLLNKSNVDPLPRDRWDRTPLDDAESFDHPKCAKLIMEACKRKGIKPPISYKAYMALSNQVNGPLPVNNG